MFITKESLKEKGACGAGTRAFIERFPEGAEYQTILDALAAENNYEWASWLMYQFGTTDTVMEVNEINIEASLFFAGKIIVKGALKIAKWLLAGRGIEAGEGIKAGWGIEAGEGIEAGDDFGIYAGLKIRISQKKEYATIRAKEKPQNIVCGEFVEGTEEN